MTSINEFFPGRYFKAETLAGKARVLRIGAVERDKLSDGSVKAVVKFEDEPMKLILNRTNANAIATLYGNNTDNWIGKLIELYPTRTPFGSNMVDAVRVRAPGRRPPPITSPPITSPPTARRSTCRPVTELAAAWTIMAARRATRSFFTRRTSSGTGLGARGAGPEPYLREGRDEHPLLLSHISRTRLD